MSEHTDILTAGGGVIGVTTAWFLASEEVSVTLLDRDDLGQQASWAGQPIPIEKLEFVDHTMQVGHPTPDGTVSRSRNPG
jgi:2-polyprenyl-6-methoxyphenol hydroxylase-like FAD-dependent oxidoreductase